MPGMAMNSRHLYSVSESSHFYFRWQQHSFCFSPWSRDKFWGAAGKAWVVPYGLSLLTSLCWHLLVSTHLLDFNCHPSTGILAPGCVSLMESQIVGRPLESLWLSHPYFQVQDPFPPNCFFSSHWFRVLLALLQGWGLCLLGVCPSGVKGIL